MKTTEVGGERGYDGGKKITGRKRHLAVDTMGMLMAVVVTGAHIDDAEAAPYVFDQLRQKDYPRLKTLWGDTKYHNHKLNAWKAKTEKGSGTFCRKRCLTPFLSFCPTSRHPFAAAGANFFTTKLPCRTGVVRHHFQGLLSAAATFGPVCNVKRACSLSRLIPAFDGRFVEVVVVISEHAHGAGAE